MPLTVEYDTKSPPQWFRLNNIKYWLWDPIVINGEESSVYYGLISEIKQQNLLKVKWFYLPHEMVMSRFEKESLHPNEIFITDCEDEIDIESVQMKAAIFNTKGFAPPKKVPQEWLILRRKYDPYKNTIKTVDLVADNLHRIDKLNVSLCEPDHKQSQKTPRRTATKNSRKTSKDSFESDSDMGSTKTVTSSDESSRERKLSKRAPSTTIRSPRKHQQNKNSYFFLSSEDFPLPGKQVESSEREKESRTEETPKRSTNSRSSKIPNTSGMKSNSISPIVVIEKTKVKKDSKHVANNSEVRRGRSTKLTSELQILSLSPGAGDSSKSKSGVIQNGSKTPTQSLSRTPTQTTRSGRKIKPVENFHCLQKSLALEALMKSNLLEKKTKSQESSESDEDSEISFKENEKPKPTTPASRTKKSNTNKKKTWRESSCSESSGEEYSVKKKKRSNLRTPLAPKNLKPTDISTPCVVPLRDSGSKIENSYSAARVRLHVSAVPESLPCREEQFADIYYFLETKLEEQSGGCMYISGVPGTGKTATVRDALTHISDGSFDYQMIEVNGMKLSDPKQLYSLIYRHLEGKKVTPDHGNLLLSEYFGKNEKKSIVLVVDELDLLWTRKQHVMYNLFDWPNRPNSKLVVIAIANTMDLPERMLMNKVASRLGLTRMTFQPYSHKQLLEIINSRLDGTSAFAPEACMLAARKVAAASGDARRALDICRHAIDIAEQEDAGTITSLHIQRAITNMYQSAKTKAIINCTLYQKIFLKSVLVVFRRKGVEEAVFKEVYEVFCSLCQFQGLFCPPCGAMLHLCKDLGSSRILLVEHGPPTLHTHIRLNCSQDDVVFALKEGSS